MARETESIAISKRFVRLRRFGRTVSLLSKRLLSLVCTQAHAFHDDGLRLAFAESIPLSDTQRASLPSPCPQVPQRVGGIRFRV